MKKPFLISFVSAILMLASCSSKKDWTCDCPLPTVPNNSTTPLVGKTSFVVVNSTEDDAKKSCSIGNKITGNGISVSFPCTLQP